MDMCLLSSRVGAASNCRGRSVVMNWKSRVYERWSPLSLSFPPYSSLSSLAGTTLAHQQNLSPLHRRYHHQATNNRVVNHHARHQYHRNQHALFVAIRIKKKKGRKRNRRERITANPFESAFSHGLVRIHIHAHGVPDIFCRVEKEPRRTKLRVWVSFSRSIVDILISRPISTVTSGDESETASSFRRRFSDVFRNSTTFDTTRATAVTKLLRLFCLLLLVLPLRRTRSQQVQARSFTRIGSRSRDRVSSAVGPSSSESDGVMDANNVISLSRRIHVVGVGP